MTSGIPSQAPLSRALIETQSDDELDGVIWDFVHRQVVALDTGEPYRTRRARILEQASPGLRAAYATRVLEEEVFNGGFNQFFYNEDAAMATMALEAFRRLGAPDYAAVVEAARKMAATEAPAREAALWKRTIAAFMATYQTSSLARLDDKFSRLWETCPLPRIRGQYIRRHPDEFCVD